MRKRNLPSLTSLRAFEAFARRGAMTLAADELFVTHGAVSRQVRLLEDSLGLALTEGPRHRLKLTEAGAALARTLSSAFDQIESTVAAVGRARTDEVHLSCVGTLAIRWLIPALADFHDRRPDIRVRVTESYAPVDFTRDRFDAAIRIAEAPPVAGVEAIAFLDNFHGPVLSPRLKGSGETGLEGLPRLTTSTRQSAWSEWEGHAGVTLPQTDDVQEFEHIFYVLEAAAAGLGVGLSPWIYVARDIAEGRLAAPLGFVPTPSRFWFLTPHVEQAGSVATFRDWLIETAGRVTAPPQATPQVSGETL